MSRACTQIEAAEDENGAAGKELALGLRLMAAARGRAGGRWRTALAALCRDKAALAAAVFLGCAYGVALFAEFIAPYGVNETHYRAPMDYRYHPPMRVHVRDEQGRLHWPPFVYGTQRSSAGEYVENRSVRYPLRLMAKGSSYSGPLGLLDWNRHLFGVDEPGRVFLLGTDRFGRDILTRVIYGARISLAVGLVGVAISLALGLTVGAVAGYYGGIVDAVLMRSGEVLLSLPALYLVVALAGVLPAEMSSALRFMLISAILSLIGWAGISRVARGIVHSVKGSDYVLGAKALGASNWRIIRKHVIPNTASYAVVAATLSIPYYIVGEASLSFLGLGIKEPQASWGLMLAEAQSVTALRHFTWLLFPGIAISLVVLCFNLLGDWLRDLLDPRASSDTVR